MNAMGAVFIFQDNGTGTLSQFVSVILGWRINTNAASSVIHWRQQILKTRWLNRDSPHKTAVSACFLTGLLNARCAVPDARVPGHRFPPVSWFFSAELQRSVHSAQSSVTLWRQGCSVIWSGGSINATLFAFFYYTINGMVLAFVFL